MGSTPTCRHAPSTVIAFVDNSCCKKKRAFLLHGMCRRAGKVSGNWCEGIAGPLFAGATQVLFEGVPTYPDAGRAWDIVDKYKVLLIPHQLICVTKDLIARALLLGQVKGSHACVLGNPRECYYGKLKTEFDAVPTSPLQKHGTSHRVVFSTSVLCIM